MHKRAKKGMRFCAVVLLALLSLTGCGSKETADGKVKLSFQIWDTAQRAGMQAVIDEYEKTHPNVTIDLQVTSWDEYWTKLDAAAESNQLPDIFWMHTNQILKYADYGMLADVLSFMTMRIQSIMRSIFLKFLWEMPEALMADFTEFPRIRIPWDWYTTERFLIRQA